MTIEINPDFTEKNLGNKNQLGISAGCNVIIDDALQTIRSDVYDYFPTDNHFPIWNDIDGNGFNEDWIIATQLTDWKVSEIQDPEKDPEDYVKDQSYMPSPGTDIWIYCTLTLNTTTGLYNVGVNSSSFPSAIDFATLPDALLLKSYWKCSGYTPTIHFVDDIKLKENTGNPIEETPNAWMGKYLDYPYWKMGEYNVPRFTHFPITYDHEGTIVKYFEEIDTIANPSPPYIFVPDFKGESIDEWLGLDLKKEIYKKHFRDKFEFYFYKDADEKDLDTEEGNEIRKVISGMKRHPMQCPQDVTKDLAGEILNATNDMVFMFGSFLRNHVICKFNCVGGYYLDSNGDKVLYPHVYRYEYIPLWESVLPQWAIDENAWSLSNPDPLPIRNDEGIWMSEGISYYEDQSYDTYIGLRFYYQDYSTYGGLSPYYLGLRPDKTEKFIEGLKEVHLESGRDAILNGFWWNCEQSKLREGY